MSEKAVWGSCTWGNFRWGVNNTFFSDLKRAVEKGFAASSDVTKRELSLSDTRDATTGWYVTSYSESTIKGIIFTRAARNQALKVGVYVNLDATVVTLDSLQESDQILANGKYYEVKTKRESHVGDNFYCRHCDLKLLPLENLAATIYSDETVEDAKYRTKVYLETYLDTDYLPRFIVAYGKPNYPMTRVFNDKHVDLVFSIGEPDSTALIGSSPTPYGYEEHVPIYTFCVDKYGVTGAKLKWSAEAELRRVTETYPEGSRRSLERRGDNDRLLGSTMLYSAQFILKYRRGTS